MWPPRHSLITGAGSGIGAAMARQLAGMQPAGRRLTLTGRRPEALEAVAQDCRRAGAVVDLRPCDVRDRAGMWAAIDEADAAAPLDLVIANAGVSGGTEGDPRAIIDINISGVLNTVEPVIEPMRQRREGRIAIMASIAAFKSFPNAPLYCASKSAVRSYGEAMAARLRDDGIKVSVLCPGFVTTPLTDANPFPMPLIMPADRAATRLLRGIERGAVRIAFPWPLYAVTRLMENLPAGLAAWLLARLARNAGLKE